MSLSRIEPDAPRTAVLLSVYNGERFLLPQIQSLKNQTVAPIDLWISDDGSSDGSDKILTETERLWDKGTCRRLAGPRDGFAANFRALLANPDIEADYIAFCDQDDLWDEDKLAAAIAWLAAEDPKTPSLYCTRTRLIAEDGSLLGYSPLFPRTPTFQNAILQSIAGGNTMVMNKAAHELMREASRRSDFVSHDWWCYMMVTGAGGRVHYSPEARIGYRQHGRNLVGANSSWPARLRRVTFLTKGGFQDWNAHNLAGLRACWDLLTPDARNVIERIEQARSGALPKRLSALWKSGAYRQTVYGDIGLYVGCIINRL